MKKLSLALMIAAVISFSACNSPQKTGDAQADSGSHGSSGASDTTQSIKGSPSLGTSASGTASSGSDTTKTSH